MSQDSVQSTKYCFVVGPIGAKDSQIRNKADWLLYAIIRPVFESFEYRVERADETPHLNTITDQIIASVTAADVLVADLTGHNPNAFYELAVRHMTGKPIIHMIEIGESIPFDVHDMKAIIYDLQSPETAETAKRELSNCLKAIESGDQKIMNPIVRANVIQELSMSSEPTEQLLASVYSHIGALQQRLLKIEDSPIFESEGVSKRRREWETLFSARSSMAAPDPVTVGDLFELVRYIKGKDEERFSTEKKTELFMGPAKG